MRTSAEVYHRVRWDPRFDPTRFVLGIEVRRPDPKRVPLTSFVPGGDIPWHRVLFIEADGEVVWDRGAGIDRLDRSRVGLVLAERLLDGPFPVPGTPHRWDGAAEAWVPARPVAQPFGGSGHGRPGAGLRVLTWNVLWDRYDRDRIHTARRLPLLVEAIRRADADIIALQEVHRGLIPALLDRDWTRDGYTADLDPAGARIDDNGLLLLSRLPVTEAGWLELRPHKAVVAVTVTTTTGPVVVATTHLSSDHSAAGAARRREELDHLAAVLPTVGTDLILVGDLNDGTALPARILGAEDAWTTVHGPGDTTATFDPGANPLAAVSSLTGRAGRLDRVLLRAATWRPVAASLLGDRPVGPERLLPSDHYGVVVDLVPGPAPSWPPRRPTTGPAEPRSAAGSPPPRLTAAASAALPTSERHPFPAPADPAGSSAGARDGSRSASSGGAARLATAPTPRTALVWLPPPGVADALEPLRRRHDPGSGRWPAHVTLLHGFVPEWELERAAGLVAAVAGETVPFTTLLAGTGTFPGRGGTTVWLDPAADDPGPWRSLQAALADRFPACGRPDRAFTPHLTVGRGARPDEALSAAQAAVAPTLVTVGELVLLSRRGAEPMRPRATVTLGSGEVRWHDDDPGAGPPSPTPAREVALARSVTAQVAAALPGSTVRVVGSRRIGGALAGADLDLVAAVSGAVDPAAVAAALAATVPGLVDLVEVTGARVPGLRFSVAGLPVDLVLVGTGGIPPDEAVARRAELGREPATALSAVSDAEAVVAAIGADQAAFDALALQVKALARARGLDSAPSGGLPGIAWAVLVAVTIVDGGRDLGDFLTNWAAWDWSRPVALPGDRPVVYGGPVAITTPTHPVRSCTAGVDPAGAGRLAEELYEAWEAVTGHSGGIPWSRLLAPPPLHRRHAAWALVTVPAGDGSRMPGRVRGRILALVRALVEAGCGEAHPWPHPVDAGPGLIGQVIGLGRTPPDESWLDRVTGPWRASLPGVGVTRLAGGDLPTIHAAH